MPFFSKVFRGKDSGLKKSIARNGSIEEAPNKPQWKDAWMRKDVEPEEVQELLRGCTHEIKARGMETSPKFALAIEKQHTCRIRLSSKVLFVVSQTHVHTRI